MTLSSQSIPQMAAPATGRQFLRVYGMSDIHLNNHHRQEEKSELQHRPMVIQFLDEMIDEQEREAGEIVLVLNGDIFDITNSWPVDVSPLAPEEKLAETIKNVLADIIDCNPEVMKRLRQLLVFPDTRIVYIVGNHDRWINQPDLAQYLKQALGLPADSHRFEMSRRFYLPEIRLLALHGDEFDPACKPPANNGLNRAERLDMIFLNGLLERVCQRLKSLGYSEQTIRQIQDAIQALDYVRPIHHALDYLYQRLDQLKQSPDNHGKRENVKQVVQDEILDAFAQALQDPDCSWVYKMATALLIRFLSFRIGQRCLNFYISGARKILRDRYQLSCVRHLLETEESSKNIQLVYLGHTHRLLFQETTYFIGLQGKSCLVMNAGGHKKTIFYPNPDEIFPAGMMAVVYDRSTQTMSANLETNTRRLFIGL